MPMIDIKGTFIVGRDDKAKEVDLADMNPATFEKTIFEALQRGFTHWTSNVGASKAGAERRKAEKAGNGAAFDYDAALDKARDEQIEDILTGDWMKGARIRAVAMNLQEALEARYAERDTLKQLRDAVKSKRMSESKSDDVISWEYKVGPNKGKSVSLDEAVDQYLNDATRGEGRRAAIAEEATKEVAKRQRDREDRIARAKAEAEQPTPDDDNFTL